MEISERLRKIRTDRGQSQQVFAEELGLKQPAYANYETGSRSIPDEIKTILSRYGISLDWLITGKGSMYTVPQTIGQRIAAAREHYPYGDEGFMAFAQLTEEEFTDIATDKVKVSDSLIRRLTGNLNIREEYLQDGTGSIFTDKWIKPGSVAEGLPLEAMFPDLADYVKKTEAEKKEIVAMANDQCKACNIMHRLDLDRQKEVVAFAKFKYHEQKEDERSRLENNQVG